jgi:hypothetical protein
VPLEIIEWRKPDCAIYANDPAAVFQITSSEEWIAATSAIKTAKLAKTNLERYCANTLDLS